jgi:hypothetical protein
MAQLSGAIAAKMNKHRAYLVGEGGHFAGSRSFVCGTDAEAAIWAKQLVDGTMWNFGAGTASRSV